VYRDVIIFWKERFCFFLSLWGGGGGGCSAVLIHTGSAN